MGDSKSPGPVAPPVIVGVGSSAGGLEALQEMCTHLLPGGGASFVIAQHMAPDRASAMVELLTKSTRLPVREAVDGTVLQPDTIYVGAPGSDVVVSGDRLSTPEPSSSGHGPTPSIDRLFTSIAESCGSRGAAVVLSGTGVDGTQGLRSINAVDGLAVVQTPESAKFEAMPRSAIALASVDVIADPAGIGDLLTRLAATGKDWVPLDSSSSPDSELAAISVELLKQTGMDLSGYRESTIRRQVGRRMAIRGIETASAYLKALRNDVDEATSLKQNLLVSVTSFFRDPAAYDALREQLRALIADRPDGHLFRVWVAGCATGEEVYSLAMLFADLIPSDQPLTTRLKIFGTDLDEDALAIARRGQYPASTRIAIPSELADRYTHVDSDSFTVATQLRDCIVFARHNVIEDPPFPRLDLVSCRNLLIYFTTGLQARVIERLIYPITLGGLLWLGAAESIGAEAQGVDTVDPTNRIYRRTDLPVAFTGHINPASAWRPTPATALIRQTQADRDPVSDERFAVLESLSQLGPPCLVLDEQNDLIEVVGDVSRYCRLAPGPLSATALSYLRDELEGEARALLLAGRGGEAPLQGRTVELSGGDGFVHLEVRRLPLAQRAMTVLSFVPDETPQPRITKVERDPLLDREIKRLERELLASQVTLRTSLEELESTNEELQASSEELQAATEELQSSYEELETSNEELEATNTELRHVNQQLRDSTDELQTLNDDLENIQTSVNQGMVLVDRDLLIQRYTPLAVHVFAMTPDDIGRGLLTVRTTIPMPGFAEALHAVVGGADRRSLEISEGHSHFLVQVMPYLASGELVRGAIITLTDIDEVVQLRQAQAEALQALTKLTNTLQEAVWRREGETLTYVSRRIVDLTGFTPEEILADTSLLDGLIIPQDRESVATARAHSDFGWDVEYRILDRFDQTRWVREVATASPDTAIIVGTLSDTTERRMAEADAADRATVMEAVFGTSVFGVAILDATGSVSIVNNELATLLGHTRDEILGRLMTTFLAPSERTDFDNDLNVARTSGEPQWAPARQMMTKNGESVWVAMDTRALPPTTTDASAVVIVQDVTDERAHLEQLARHARYDVLTGLVNRRTLREIVDRELARATRAGQKLALLWVDLDRFKEVNDQFGHEVGDSVLRTSADRMRAAVRRQDVVGRLGGDEFAIVVTGLGEVEELDGYLDRIVEALAQTITESDAQISTGGSVGVAVYPYDGGTADELMRAADHAMYAAKGTGGSTYAYFRQSMGDEADRRRTLRQDLAAALERDEFAVWFQPVVDIATGRARSVEVLTRWQRHDDGLVAAADFISFAEDSGQLRALGRLTLNSLIPQMAALREAGHDDLQVAINLSVSQLSDPATIDLIRDFLMANDRPPLLVEVTESLFLPDNQRAQDAMVSLERAGAAVVIDDFGSGFSNLRLLRSVAPTWLKLDRSFLTVDQESAEGMALMKSAIQMSHAIDAEVVVEGIEEDWQMQRARAMGAEMAQGYLIARPMPLPQLLDWLRENEEQQSRT